MRPSTSFENLRPLGLLEQYASARHSLGFYNNVATSAVYTAPTVSTSIQSLLYRALPSVIARHPSLSAIVVDEHTAKPYFARLPQIDLEKLVVIRQRLSPPPSDEDDHDQELVNLLEEQHNTDFKDRLGQLPFWRLVILVQPEDGSSFVACFVHHHSLADGLSGHAFHRSLLDALSSVAGDAEDSEPPITVIATPQNPLLPSLEDLHALPISWVYLGKQLWNHHFGGAPPLLWTAQSCSNRSDQRTTRVRSLEVSRDRTAVLAAVSRKHAATMTATLHALVAAVLFRLLPADRCASLQSDGPISLRPYISSALIDQDSLGCMLSSYSYVHHRPAVLDSASSNVRDYFSWNEAQRVRQTIQAETSKRGKDSATGLLSYAGDMRQFFEKKIGQPRGTSFEISNVGVFNKPEYGSTPWSIGKMVFSQSAGVVGASLQLSLITGGDGRLVITLSWLEGIVDNDFALSVLQDLGNAINELAVDA